jgi:hypothetical protein
VSEETEKLQRAVDRLLDAQQEAIDATSRALGAGAEDLDERLGTSERLEATLVDVRDILEGALEDTRDILGDGA